MYRLHIAVIILTICFGFFNELKSQEVDDPDLLEWAVLYNEGNLSELDGRLMDEISENGKNKNYAAYIWCLINDNQSAVTEEIPLLKRSCQLRSYRNTNDGEKMMAEYSPTEVVNWQNIWDIKSYYWELNSSELEQTYDALLLDLIKKGVGDFNVAWSVINSIGRSELFRQDLLKILKKLDCCNSEIRELLLAVASYSDARSHQKIEAFKTIYGQDISDYGQSRFMATLYSSIGDYDKSAKLWKQTVSIFPYGNTVDNAAFNLYKSGDQQQAFELLEQKSINRSRHNESEQKDLLTQYRSELYREVGEWGKARETVKARLGGGSEFHALYNELAIIEMESKRFAEAADVARKAYELKNRSAYFTVWLEAMLENGNAMDVWETYREFSDKIDHLDERSYWVVGEALMQIEAFDLAIELYRVALEDYPESGWMNRSLGGAYLKAGDIDSSIIKLQQSVSIRSNNLWAFYRLADAYDEYYGESAQEQFKKDIVNTYPALENAWNGYAQLNASNSAHIYEKARVTNPNEYWPVNRLVLELNLMDDSYEEQYSVFEETKGCLENYHKDAVIKYYSDYAIAIIEESGHEIVDSEFLELAVSLNNEFRMLGGERSVYHYNRYRLYQSNSQGEKAANELLKALDYDPDNLRYLQTMFVDEAAMHLDRQRFIRFHRYVERNPWDGSRIEKLAHYHLRWGGSAIIALNYYERLSEIAPDKVNMNEHSAALEKIGNRTALYRQRYHNNLGDIANSDRYIDWYHSTRKNAQRESLDYKLEDDGSVTIFHVNGMIAKYRDHPVTGKPLLIQFGAAFVKAEYDDFGNLLKIESSSDLSISLGYDEYFSISQVDFHEAGITSESWYFEYDENRELTKVTNKDEHTLTMTRNNDGELIRVDAPDAHATYLVVTKMMDRLRYMISMFENNRYGNIPDLPYQDEKEIALNEHWAESAGIEKISAGIAYTEYLLENLQNHQDYTENAGSVLSYLSGIDVSKIKPEQRLKIIQLWYRFLRKTRPLGVDQHFWDLWQRQIGWLEQQSFGQQIAREAESILQKITDEPIELLPSARWMPGSDYMNPAYWNRQYIDILGHPFGVSLQVHSVFERDNGDLLAGTSHGLAVNRKGYWELLVFDDLLGRFTKNPSQFITGNKSMAVLSIVEDRYSGLWLGTRNGLLYLDKDYTSRPMRWRTLNDGLPHPGVHSLMLHGDSLYIATSEGLAIKKVKDSKIHTIFDRQIKELNRTISHDGPYATVVSSDGIYMLEENGLIKVHDSQTVRSAILSEDESQIFFLEGNMLFRKPVEGTLKEKYPITGQRDIVKTTNILSLRYLPVDIRSENDLGIAVLSDQGITVFYKSNFEFLSFSDQIVEKREQVNDLIVHNNKVYAILQGDILEFSREAHRTFPEVIVQDMIHAPAWDYTFLAAGESLLYFDNQKEQPSVFDYIDSSHLAITEEGGLLTTDGDAVVYYAPGSAFKQQLFTSRNLAHLQNVNTVQVPEKFNSLIRASDGTIWATTATTVFRFVMSNSLEHRNEEVFESELFVYSMFKDQEEFPANSDMISKVLETKDGEIWVVASDEGHRWYKGVRLTGGLMRFDGDGFEDITDQLGSDWFVTSYTQLDEETAIAGTTQGFVLHQGQRYRQLFDLQDPSYLDLRERMPMLWLGTRGTKFGESTYLFGTPGGVVLFNNGEWFYPENLNRSLPEDMQFAERGGRHIHSISTDNAGKIFISTDRGLLVYDLGDNEDTLLFQENNMTEQAIRHHQRRQLIRESDVLFDALSGLPEVGDLINEIRHEEKNINELEDRLRGNLHDLRDGNPSYNVSTFEKTRQESHSILNRQLEDRRRNYQTLTRLLEMEHHGAFQMLQLNPLDVAQLRHKLGADEQIAVYIPTQKKLTIQLINNDEVKLIEVDIESEELMQMSTLVADNLAGRDFSGRRTISSTVEPDVKIKLDENKLNNYLNVLYELLLRPLEPFVTPEDLLYIVPSEALSYLPYNALLRSREPHMQYAVQRFTTGILPSMYLLDLALRHQPSTSQNAMVVGDPDGSLPGARQEARDIYELLRPASPLLLGNAADRQSVIRYAENARIVHFATHGKLNPDQPARSYLLLANDHQLGVADVMQLPLHNTDLVVLSACETGLGTTGLEFATLARAFAHAGAPSILATLWEVPDESSKHLITNFYDNLKRGENIFQALAEAQRDFLTNHPHLQMPVKWAGYVAFGKP